MLTDKLNNPIERVSSILYPTDLSTDDDRAIDYAALLAVTYNAKLYLLHVTDAPVSEDQIKFLNERFEGLIATEMSPSDPMKFNWEGIIGYGDPAEAIVREATERKIDLIVMQSRRRPYAAALVGSTAETVTRQSPCPVFVVHPHERDWVGTINEKADINRIMVPYDFSGFAKLALNHAMLFGYAFNAEIHLVNVVAHAPENSPYPTSENPLQINSLRLQELIPVKMRDRLTMKNFVVEGDPFPEILNYAKVNSIDLICMGAHGEGYTNNATFGTTTDRVLRDAPCPILIARYAAARVANSSL